MLVTPTAVNVKRSGSGNMRCEMEFIVKGYVKPDGVTEDLVFDHEAANPKPRKRIISEA